MRWVALILMDWLAGGFALGAYVGGHVLTDHRPTATRFAGLTNGSSLHVARRPHPRDEGWACGCVQPAVASLAGRRRVKPSSAMNLMPSFPSQRDSRYNA